MKMILSVYSLYSNGAPSPHLATIFHEDQKAAEPSCVHPQGSFLWDGSAAGSGPPPQECWAGAAITPASLAATRQSAEKSELDLCISRACSVLPHTFLHHIFWAVWNHQVGVGLTLNSSSLGMTLVPPCVCPTGWARRAGSHHHTPERSQLPEGWPLTAPP